MKSLRIIRMWWVGIVLAVTAHSSFAMLRILFSPDVASWEATHIVVVKTTAIDGAFEVVESWKGGLSAGSRVLIPELIPPVNGIPISAYPRWSPDDRSGILEQIPRQPVGSQLVLFLKRKEASEAKSETRNPDWSGWSRTHDPDSMKIAAVWIDSDKTYSFQQQGSTLSPLVLSIRGKISEKEGQHFVAESKEDLKRDVAETLQIQKDEEAAISVTSGRKRALQLKPYANSKIFPARLLALEELGKAGPEAVGTIGEMLDDPTYSEQASELVQVLVNAGGTAVGAELNRRLKNDLAFWSSTCPSLSQNWWNQDPTPSSPLRNRYAQTYSLVYALTQVRYPGALNIAIKLRDLWLAHPQLASVGANQITEACDKLIAELQSH